MEQNSIAAVQQRLQKYNAGLAQMRVCRRSASTQDPASLGSTVFALRLSLYLCRHSPPYAARKPLSPFEGTQHEHRVTAVALPSMICSLTDLPSYMISQPTIAYRLESRDAAHIEPSSATNIRPLQ